MVEPVVALGEQPHVFHVFVDAVAHGHVVDARAVARVAREPHVVGELREELHEFEVHGAVEVGFVPDHKVAVVVG